MLPRSFHEAANLLDEPLRVSRCMRDSFGAALAADVADGGPLASDCVDETESSSGSVIGSREADVVME